MARSQKGKVAERLKAAAKKITGKAAPKKAAPKKAAPKTASAGNHGIKKEYLKSKKLCKVTFRLPSIAVSNAKSACIVGDFNNWSLYANPMKKLKSGDCTITLELKSGREYQFRYLINETRWENDWNADKYVKSPYGDSDNSVIII